MAIQNAPVASLKQILTNRTIQFRYQNVLSPSITYDNEILQRSLISLTLFTIAISDLINNIKPPVEYVLLADDPIILYQGVQIQNFQILSLRFMIFLITFLTIRKNERKSIIARIKKTYQ